MSTTLLEQDYSMLWRVELTPINQVSAAQVSGDIVFWTRVTHGLILYVSTEVAAEEAAKGYIVISLGHPEKLSAKALPGLRWNGDVLEQQFSIGWGKKNEPADTHTIEWRPVPRT